MKTSGLKITGRKRRGKKHAEDKRDPRLIVLVLSVVSDPTTVSEFTAET